MDDLLTADQCEIRELVREVVRRAVAPRAAEIDETGEFPWDMVELFREHGLFGLPFERAVRRHRHRRADGARRDRGDLARSARRAA